MPQLKKLDDMLFIVYRKYAVEVMKLREVPADDYYIEDWSNAGGVNIGDMFYPLDDMRIILKYNISKSIYYEYYDMKSMGYNNDRVVENYDKIKDYNLYNFYMFFKE